MPELIGRDLWLKYTDNRGRETVRCHRVWDADRFLQEQIRRVAEANDEMKGGKVELTEPTSR